MAVGCQRIEPQDSAVISATIVRRDSTPSRNAGKNSGHTGGMHRTGPGRYRNRRAFVMREVPLYMLPAAVRRGVKERGGKIYRAVIVRTHWNHYTITARIKPVHRGLEGFLEPVRADGVTPLQDPYTKPDADSNEGGA
jgi:hypothetical protein